MRQGCDDVPIVCCLTSAELRERGETLFAEFRSAVIETEELLNGYAFRISGDGRSIENMAEIMMAERECCPFLRFELTAEPNMGPIIVRVTGPAGTKDFLKTILWKPETSI